MKVNSTFDFTEVFPRHIALRSSKRGNVRINYIEARSRNHCCRVKAISVTYSECVSVVLVIQDAKRMRRIVLSTVTSLALLYFSTQSLKLHDFRKKKKVTGHKFVFWFSLQILSETFLIIRRIERDIIINVHGSSWNVPVIFVRFKWNWYFLDRFSKNPQISNSI